MPDGAFDLGPLLKRFRADFLYYAPRMLKVKPKAGGDYVAFAPNRAQRYIHEQLEAQRQSIGRVRALVLKARQQGASTYIEGRFFWRTQLWKLMKAMILTHEDKATQNLFGMARTYHEQLPSGFAQRTLAANANTLRFATSESEYAVATAGSKDTGRSQTAQLFHGSEVAFWDNAGDHMQGIGQIVADAPGTEIILESTANGIGGEFHQRWQAAESGLSEYLAIFIPWFWSDEYRAAVPEGFEFDAEDREYQALYELDDQQLYWRRRKIDGDFGGDESRFMQEYPANSVEAFVSNSDSYIAGKDIARARKAKGIEPNETLIIGIDPKRFGDDRFGIAWRRGRVIEKVTGSRADIDTMEAAGMIANIIDTDEPAKVFIDYVGLGAGVYDRLKELGYGNLVTPVNAGSAADEPTLYINKRAEMRGRCKEWFAEAPNSIPDSDELARDLLAPGYKYDSNQRLKIETKDDMRKRGVRSPDLGDAVDLTFAYRVSPVKKAVKIKSRRLPWQAH